MNPTTVPLSAVLSEQLKNPDVAVAFHQHHQEIELVMQIIAARKARHWTQHELAQKAGIRQQVLSRIECQKTTPNLTSLMKLAEALDLELIFIPRTDHSTQTNVSGSSI